MAKLIEELRLRGPIFLLRVAIYCTLGFVTIYVNPFDIQGQTDKATSHALDQIFAKFYPDKAQDVPLVVLINEQSIKHMHNAGDIVANEWPLTYGDHASLLKGIAALQPQSIFLDIYFRNERSTDAGFDRLISAINTVTDAGINVYLASAQTQEGITKTQEKLQNVATLTEVSWTLPSDLYPLKLPNDDDYLNSAAFDLYQDFCQSKPDRCEKNIINSQAEPIAVQWGGSVATDPVTGAIHPDCKDIEAGPIAFAKQLVIEGLGYGLLESRSVLGRYCPFHQNIHIEALIEASRRGDESLADARNLVKDRVVLVGMNLTGLQDRVFSPVHGEMPAVFVHAMALDNLIAKGNEYRRLGGDFSDLIAMSLWVFIVVVLAASSKPLSSNLRGTTTPDSADLIVQSNPLPGRWATILITAGFAAALMATHLMNYRAVNFLAIIALLSLTTLLIKDEFTKSLLNKISNIQKKI